MIQRRDSKEIEEEGLKDKDYNTTRLLVLEGKQHKVKGEYRRVANELDTDGNLLIRGKTIVVPKGEDGTMRKRILDAAHEGHPGVSQLKTN